MTYLNGIVEKKIPFLGKKKLLLHDKGLPRITNAMQQTGI